MSGDDVTYLKGGPIFDGTQLLSGHAARFEDGIFAELLLADVVPVDAPNIDLKGDILSPGYVDLQVNGGDGIMFNDDPSVETLQRIADAHRRLGTARILPTLITDTPAKTQAAIDAAIAAIGAGVTGIAGLHLEGPHLSVARKGAHDAALIRPMDQADMDNLLHAAQDLPVLMVTLAPENVSEDQVRAMTEAGIVVSLGHSDADYATCMEYADAGARCVTHLFNAMSQLGNREPGLVGAALSHSGLSAGMIADGLHVHPSSMRTAWTAKAGPGQIFLVSDAMAVAGTDKTEFFLEGRQIRRSYGRLTLDDGTLAGADLDLTTAIRILTSNGIANLDRALLAATTGPAGLVGIDYASSQLSGMTESDFIRIRPDLSGLSPYLNG